MVNKKQCSLVIVAVNGVVLLVECALSVHIALGNDHSFAVTPVTCSCLLAS